MPMNSMRFAAIAALVAGCAAAQAPSIERLDPALDALIPKDAKVEKVAGNFKFVEGPLWRTDGHLWFSDLMANMIRSITPDGKASVILENSGGVSTAPPGGYVGSNGLVADKDGAILLCQHTNRDIARLDKNMKLTPYIQKYDGKRFNSPNDLVYRSDGSLYFTDPTYGLPKGDTDPARELTINGVFRYANGKVEAVIKDLTRPNGIAFSPDGNTLYVSNSEPKKLWMKYDVAKDGSVSNGKVLFDVTNVRSSAVPDGMKVDSKGNIYGSAAGGIWILSPEGKHLGTIKLPENASNCNWGDDGKSLYITAVTSVYRVKMAVAGEKALYR